MWAQSLNARATFAQGIFSGSLGCTVAVEITYDTDIGAEVPGGGLADVFNQFAVGNEGYAMSIKVTVNGVSRDTSGSTHQLILFDSDSQDRWDMTATAQGSGDGGNIVFQGGTSMLLAGTGGLDGFPYFLSDIQLANQLSTGNYDAYRGQDGIGALVYAFNGEAGIPCPEPDPRLLGVAAVGTLGLLTRLRRRLS